MSQQPWVSGPSEILQHGLSLLNKDSDTNRRLAMLSIDNAVELTIKTFLSLPRRITGKNLTRKEYQEISESFPQLLDALEKHASDKLNGIDLGEIEWFHRLRNQLYHQGNGLTVDKDKVEIYSQLAELLFYNLFSFDIKVEIYDSHDLRGQFLATWVEVEHLIGELFHLHENELAKLLNNKRTGIKTRYEIRSLAQLKIINQDDVQNFMELNKIRYDIIHGETDYKEVVTTTLVTRTKKLSQDFRNKLTSNRNS